MLCAMEDEKSINSIVVFIALVVSLALGLYDLKSLFFRWAVKKNIEIGDDYTEVKKQV